MLTSREIEILKCIINGMSNEEIAHEKFISVHTAKAHVKSILRKFGVNSRLEIAVIALIEGIVDKSEIKIKQNFSNYI